MPTPIFREAEFTLTVKCPFCGAENGYIDPMEHTECTGCGAKIKPTYDWTVEVWENASSS